MFEIAMREGARNASAWVFELQKKRIALLLAAKILFLLTHSRKRLQRGKLHRLPPGASQRLALDVLIAVSARRWKAQVVTENWTDFKAIQRFCNTTIVKAAQFFKA